MKKFISLFLLLVGIGILVIGFYYGNKEKKDLSDQNRNQLEETENTEDGNEVGEKNDKQISSIILEIYAEAEKGKIPHIDTIVGETLFEEILARYGEPKQIDDTVVGKFAVYEEPKISIGFYDGVIFDLRCHEQYLSEIHYEDLLEQIGEPIETRYYQDETYDQIILVYQVNENYQLKWILDKPTELEPNPALSHISVVALNPHQKQQLTIEEKVARMTLDEKIGQMIFAGVSETAPSIEENELITKYKVGGIILNKPNMVTSSQTIQYINQLKEFNRVNSIPLFFGVDQEGGSISKLPGNLIKIPTNREIGDMNQPDFSYELGQLLGQLVKSYGFNINFAPVLDVDSNPHNPVIGDRSFSHDPIIVSSLGIQTMKGIQSVNIIPTIKHFPGHGDTSVDSHFELPTIHKTLEELQSLELIPFKEAVEKGADIVMIAHIYLPNIDENYPSSLSKIIMTDLLRNNLNFAGVIITDDMTMEAVTKNYSLGEAAVLSVQGGSDIIMVAHEYENIVEVISTLKTAVEKGEISEERINESVIRILKLKEKYGISDVKIDAIDVPELNRQIEIVLNKYMNS